MFHHSLRQRVRSIGLVLIVLSLISVLMTLRPNPVSAQISGPNIILIGKGVPIAHGDTTPSLVDGTDFGTDLMTQIPSGVLLYSEFMIRNTGTQTLHITSITAPAGFVLFQMNRPVAPGEEILQAIDCNDGAGLLNGLLMITSDDPDTPIYTVTIRCEHRATFDFVLMGKTLPIMNGDTTPSDADGTRLTVASTYNQTIRLNTNFQIKNNGTGLDG